MEFEIKTTSTESVVRTVLGKMYDRFGFNDDQKLISEIVEILNDPEKGEPLDESFAGTDAAYEIREKLWNRYSGGGASATATADLFHTLGRESELGWLLEDAPGYRFKG
jgi:predicted DNA-binding protein (MmcQ/YjbR family)